VKRIVFSSVTKFIAVVLFVVSIVLGALAVSDGIIEFYNDDEFIYNFESDFSQSRYISYLLNEPEIVVFNAYYNDNAVYGYDEFDNPIVRKEFVENKEIIAANIQSRFDEFYYSDKIDYYIQWNDIVITNCDAKTPEELMDGEFYSYLKRENTGNVERISTDGYRSYMIEELAEFDSTSTIIISCSIKDEVAAEYKAAWEKQEKIVFEAMKNTSVYATSALLLLIYLLCVCGKNKDGEYKNMWIDNIWTELHLALIGGFGVGAVALCAIVLDEYMSRHFPLELLDPVIGAAAALGSLGIITSLLSIVRCIKTRKLLKTSLVFIVLWCIYRILKWCLWILVKIIKWIIRQIKTFWSCIFRLLSKKSGVMFISMLFVYSLGIGICGIGSAYSYSSAAQVIWFSCGIVLFGFACFFVAYRAKDLDEIKKAVSEIRKGNTAYKITDIKCDDMRGLAINVNDIAKGLDESVEAKLKAERMKTELITNVSHDLKTPITSIINYTELLSKLEDLPEEARDYASVIAKKSERLKNLTQDLFDISKVQSGNEQIVFEKLDTALLISQSLGEYDGEIGESGLTFCVDTPKELCISADGRKMSRTISNLISNILKYAMKNTRVFITAAEKDGDVVMEFKNISAYPLDFDVDEIVQRFVRGDESRSSEGNGLGLAIAKSYTEICGGQFEITTDGDLFKVKLKFAKCG